MEVKAKLQYIHISPRKMRLVANLVRGLDVIQAEEQLMYLNKKSSPLILKTLNSAVANAIHNHDMIKENLYIAKIFIDPAPTYKRWMPRAFGRATPIMKRNSYLTIIINEKEEGKRAKKAAKMPKPETEQKEEAAQEKETETAKTDKKFVNKKSIPDKLENKKSRFSSLKSKFFRRKSI